ncbi:hypothetical protein AGMMS49546_35500 [Spirochaetia bacterium]|nr:hypothetical protein AGMMS49546_35500 [Spirochaetia bacterium]
MAGIEGTFFIVFILAICGISIFTSVQQVNEVSETVSLTIGIPIAKRAAALVDGDSFERISRTLDGEDPFYESTRLKLLAQLVKTGKANTRDIDIRALQAKLADVI